MAASPWLLSGVILVGITAVLAAIYLFLNQPPRALPPAAARIALRDHAVDTVVDVRTDAEWAAGHYPNAVHIPIQELTRKLSHQVPDRETRILFYCRTGHRAALAARIAADLGYGHTFYLAGGDYTDLDPRPTIHPN
jgi:rhodanese-related sulfurtransferase